MMGRRGFAWGVLVAAFAAFTLLPSMVPDEVEKARGLADAAANLAWLPLVGAATEIARTRLERRAERAHAERVFLADGRIVDHMADPTAGQVLDMIKRLGD